MNVLYKYCDQLGIVKILGTLELKLPFISEVNDPLECSPSLFCPDDKTAIEARLKSAFARENNPVPTDFKKKLDELFESGEIQKRLIEGQRETHKDWNKHKICLLSVSETEKETVMWAHYSEKHMGAAIGIDFNNLFHAFGVQMNRVTYSEERPRINVLEEPEVDVPSDAYFKVMMTKSVSWEYEEENRTIFGVDAGNYSLNELQKQGLASLKDFKGKKTWFLRLNPKSIRKIIVGLYADDGLKTTIKKLIDRPELQHVQLFQVKESKTYKFDLDPI